MARGIPIPQADSLPKIRRLLDELASGETMAKAMAAVELDERHTGYYLAAAEALGLGRRRAGSIALTPLGHTLLASDPRSDDEARTWRRAIERSPTVQRVAPGLLDSPAPTKPELAARIAKEAALAPTTAARRADTLLRWRKYVLGLEAQPELPNTSRSPSLARVRYSGRAMLRTVHIRSFKAFGEPKSKPRPSEPLAFAPLTVLAGPNGSGKSTVLQAIDILGALVRGNINEMLKDHGWDYSDLPHLRSMRQTFEIGVDVELGEALVEWRMTLGTRKHPGIEAESVRARPLASLEWKPLLQRVGRNITVFSETDGQALKSPLVTHPQSWLSTLDTKEDARKHPALVALKTWAEGINAFWSLDPSKLRAPSRGESKRVGAHGEDLAALLFKMKKTREKRFASFVARLKHYYPRLVQITPKSANYGWKYLDVTERWNGEKATFNARQVSDGLLRMMVLASLPEWDTPPSMVLIDEIENGLHPRLVGGITALLQEISATAQVIATTHSPITLNYVPAEAARLVTRGRGGTVVVTPLTETKNYARLREHFEPGELWYNVGEERLVTPKRSR